VGKGGGGIACRAQDSRNFYGFLALGDQRLAIVKVVDGTPELLAQGAAPGAFPGAVDTRLVVECMDDALAVSARGGDSLQARDATFGSGHSGLVVIGEKAGGTSATFDNFVLAERAP